MTRLIHRRHEILGRNDYDANIFSGVNLRLAAKRMCGLTNVAKVKLSDEFFVYQNDTHSLAEIDSMKEIVHYLRKIAMSLKSVDKENILNLSSQIEKCYLSDR